MNAVTSNTRRCCSAAVLRMAPFAWLAVFVTPYSMAFASDASGSQSVVVGEHVHDDDSPNSRPGKPPDNPGCRCDLDAVLSNGARQGDELAMSTALPIDQYFFNARFSIVIVVHSQRLPPRETSPPIYLTTQRFRI